MSKNILPSALRDVIEKLGRLPGVGARTAERYAYFLFKANPKLSDELASAIDLLHKNIKVCPVTFALIDQNQTVSPLYADPGRDKSIVAVVEEPLDIIAIENTGIFEGTYHVLGGVISPIDGIKPDDLHISELLERIKKDNVQELIIATNPSVEGESTALFIQKQIQSTGLKIKISRLARGIPAGIDLEYADQITLSHALKGRKEL